MPCHRILAAICLTAAPLAAAGQGLPPAGTPEPAGRVRYQFICPYAPYVGCTMTCQGFPEEIWVSRAQLDITVGPNGQPSHSVATIVVRGAGVPEEATRHVVGTALACMTSGMRMRRVLPGAPQLAGFD
jgi:hypothetical protein